MIAILSAEIRDEYGDVESAATLQTVREVAQWYREHGVEFSKVSADLPNGTYSYTHPPEGK